MLSFKTLVKLAKILKTICINKNKSTKTVKHSKTCEKCSQLKDSCEAYIFDAIFKTITPPC